QETCDTAYAPNNLPGYGDWSRETGFAYFDPAFCDEACARDRCSNDISCQGYTLATEAINGQHAASLKGEVTGSSAWEGYTCIKKLTECACGIGSDASTSRAMVPMALALCQAALLG
ncbi:unnamed protein product, partial [Effrenium voratum]